MKKQNANVATKGTKSTKSVKGKKVEVKTGVNPSVYTRTRQIDPIGQLVPRGNGIFRYSPELGERFQIEPLKNGQVHVFKFSFTARKMYFVETVKGNVQTVVNRIKRGTYKNEFTRCQVIRSK